MTPLRYVGAHDAVEVPLPPYGQLRATVARGETYDFPGDLAASLLEQTVNWEPASAPGPTKDDLKAQLTTLNVAFGSKATKDELQALLEDAQKTNDNQGGGEA